MRGVLLDHLVKYRLHFGFKVRLNLIDICELGKSPATIAPVIIHTGNPVGIHSRFLLFRVLSAIALDLNNEMQEIVVATAIINQNNKVRDVRPRFRAVAVGHLQPEIVILHISFDTGMSFISRSPACYTEARIPTVLTSLSSQQTARSTQNR